MRMLARRNANSMRFQRATDGRVSKDIVRRGRLLNEPIPSQCAARTAHKNCQSAFFHSSKLFTLGAEDRTKNDLCNTHQGLISASEDT